MKKEENVPEEKSVLEKLAVPLILILAIGLAFLLTVKKKLITLLTGLAVTDVSNTALNTIILICVVALVLLLFYRFRK